MVRFFLFFLSAVVFSQVLTTGSLNGVVKGGDGQALEGANVSAKHIPSGTSSGGTTRSDGSFNIPKGIELARNILSDVTELGMPTATEFLDPFTPQYIGDLVSWGAIGARTAESQTHRQMASGLSMPIGFKNGTGGSVQLATDGMVACLGEHAFLGIDNNGNSSVVITKGNPANHVILRGGASGPNYDKESVRNAQELLEKNNLYDLVHIDIVLYWLV